MYPNVEQTALTITSDKELTVGSILGVLSKYDLNTKLNVFDSIGVNTKVLSIQETWSDDGQNELLNVSLHLWPNTSASDSILGRVCPVDNSTLLEYIDARIQRFAFYDQLTGLPNRYLLNERLDFALKASARLHVYGAVLFIDLDNFKPLNDTCGHSVGDLLLAETAKRISSCVRAIDTVARFGGDEFVVVLGELSQNEDDAKLLASGIAEKIRKAITKGFSLACDSCIGGIVRHHCTSSIGISLFSDVTNCKEELIQQADRAMYHAKSAGRNTIHFHKVH